MEGHERNIQYLERAMIYIHERSAAKHSASAKCKDRGILINITFTAHFIMALTEVSRANERERSGYSQQARAAWASAAEHLQRLLECDHKKIMSFRGEYASIFGSPSERVSTLRRL